MYHQEAAKWIRKSAEQGDADAQIRLGQMYRRGFGDLPPDYKEAVKWYRKAAEQGNADAQNTLGVMYYNGEGVSKDEVEGYAWCLLAQANGIGASKTISDLEKDFTAEQMEKGKARAAKLHRLIEQKSAK